MTSWPGGSISPPRSENLLLVRKFSAKNTTFRDVKWKYPILGNLLNLWTELKFLAPTISSVGNFLSNEEPRDPGPKHTEEKKSPPGLLLDYL